MIVIRNKFIPFGCFTAINFFGVVFAKRNLSASEKNHEVIHTCQQVEWLMLYTVAMLAAIICGASWWWLCTVPLCYHAILYGILWICEWLLPPYDRAYRDIALEREAYDHQADAVYIKTRKPFAWVKLFGWR